MNNKRRLFSTVLCVAALTAGLFVSGCGSDKAGGIGSVVSSVVDGGDEKAEHEHDRDAQQHRAQRHEHAPCGGFIVDVQRRFPAQKRPFQQKGGRNEHAVPQAEGNIAEVRSVPDADDEIDDERRK